MPRGQKYKKIPWRLHGIYFRPHGMIISWSFSHGITRNIHGKSHTRFIMEFHGV